MDADEKRISQEDCNEDTLGVGNFDPYEQTSSVR